MRRTCWFFSRHKGRTFVGKHFHSHRRSGKVICSPCTKISVLSFTQQYSSRGMLQHKCITHTVPQTTLQRAHIHKTKDCLSPLQAQALNSGNEFCATQLISHLPSTGRGETRLLESPYSHRVEQGQVFCSFDRQLFCSVVVDDFRNTVEGRAVLTQDVFLFGFRQLHMHKTLTAPARKAKCKFMSVHRQEGHSTTTGSPYGGESRRTKHK